MKKEKLKELIGQMTLEEKASFCSGKTLAYTGAATTGNTGSYGFGWTSWT